MEPEKMQDHKSDKPSSAGEPTGVTSSEIKMNDDFMIAEMGYNPQMKREFGLMQLIGSAFTLTNSWLGVAGGFSTGISSAGPAGIVYGLILMLILNIFVGIALSELISAMPNSGGQYYWAMKLAPRKYARISAYITGVLNMFGAYCTTASSSIAVSISILGCVKLANPDFELSQWRVYLGAIALNLMAGVVNLWEKALTNGVFIGLWISLLSCIAITVAIPTSAKSHTDAKFIFATLENSSGWSSDAMAFIVGLINANFSFAVLDSAAHLAEETPDPARNVPKAIMFTIIIGFITAFPLTCVMMYSLTEYDQVLNTPTGSPFLELLNVAMGSKNAALGVMSAFVLAYFFSLFPQHAYQARICWAFSRDNGLPFSHIWSQVHPKANIPLQAHIFSVIMVIILGIIYIVSTTAFNSLITGVIVFPYLTYLIPMLSSVWRGGNQPKGPFNLGRIGMVAKIVTSVFSLFTIIMYSFPFVMPVTASNMNYITVIYGLAILYILVDWNLRAKKTFQLR